MAEPNEMPDNKIAQEVEAELKWDPELTGAVIIPKVQQGVVTLTGFVRTFNQKWEAESAAKRVAGVRGVANDLEVRLPTLDPRPDPEIAQDVADAIDRILPDVGDKIKVTVEDGRVTLEGAVEWHSQKTRAEHAARRVRGVTDVINIIEIKPLLAPVDLKRNIEEALKRSALLATSSIEVEAHEHDVILRGTTRSWAERQEAEQIAWRAPGVAKVENQIKVVEA
ncbi:MAG TPA: BON domain-containing protein [Arsenicitalea sp.]|nr:BON domain-containing protein [Arsenicitalea sp.]